VNYDITGGKDKRETNKNKRRKEVEIKRHRRLEKQVKKENINK
jgi:hypothetical protein